MALCSQCQKNESDPKYRPFCSKRCADLDLHAWFSGSYTIPVVENDSGLDERFEDIERAEDS